MSANSPQSTPVYATIGSRIGAYFLDVLLFGLVYALGFGLAFLGFMLGMRGSDSTAVFLMSLLYVVPLLAYGVYVVYVGGVKGYTPGKQILGLRVVDATTGQPLGVWRFILRNIVLGLIGNLTCGIGWIVLAVVANNDPRRQGWHDRAVNSVVIPASELNRPAPQSQTDPAAGVAKVPLLDSSNKSRPLHSDAAPLGISPTSPPLTPPPLSTQGLGIPNTSPTPPGQISATKPGVVGPPPGMTTSTPSSAQTPPVPTPVQPGPAVQAASSADSEIDEATRMAARQASKAPTWVLVPAFGIEHVVAEQVLVGRDPDASLVEGSTAWVVQDAEKTVSKTHALVGTDGDALWVEDWNSTNGVLVRRGDTEIEASAGEKTFLEMGDIILLGDFEVKVRIHG